MACPGVLKQAAISIEGMTFDVDLYVMPLAGYDMVLGTQWMAALGTISWDVVTHTLSFQPCPSSTTGGPCAVPAWRAPRRRSPTP